MAETFTADDFTGTTTGNSLTFTPEDFSKPQFTEADFAPQSSPVQPGDIIPQSGKVRDLQTTTRGGPRLSLPAGAMRSTLNEVGAGIGEAVSPSTIMEGATLPGQIAYAAAADVISKLPSFNVEVGPSGGYDSRTIKQDYGGNIAAIFSGGELPVDRFLAEVSKTNPNLATGAKIGRELSAMAPLAAVGMLPSWAAKLAAAGFTADMIAHAPELFKEYAEEINKPKDEQDPDKLTSLQAGVITTFAFAPLAGKHGIGTPLSDIASQARIGWETAQKFADTKAPIGPDFDVAAFNELNKVAPLTAAEVAKSTDLPSSAKSKEADTTVEPSTNTPVSEGQVPPSPVKLGGAEADLPQSQREISQRNNAAQAELMRKELEAMGVEVPAKPTEQVVAERVEEIKPHLMTKQDFKVWQKTNAVRPLGNQVFKTAKLAKERASRNPQSDLVDIIPNKIMGGTVYEIVANQEYYRIISETSPTGSAVGRGAFQAPASELAGVPPTGGVPDVARPASEIPTPPAKPAEVAIERVIYRVPATGKKSNWIKQDGGWYRADSRWNKTTKKPLEPMGLRDALERQLAQQQKPSEVAGEKTALDKTTAFINKGLSGQVGESQLGGGLGGVTATSKSKAVTQDIPVKTENLQSADPKVEARWQAAKLTKQSLWQRGKNALIRSKNAMTRHFPKLDPKEDGAVTNILRVHEGTPLVSQYMASNAIRGITSDLGPRKYGVFERIVILRDLIAYGEKFLAENSELPFGYGSIDAMRTDLAKFEGIAAKFPDIQEAVRRRDEFINAVRDDLVSRNLLPKEVKDFKAYFHHQVLEHMAMKESSTPGTGSSDVRAHKKGWQRKRIGSSKDFNTSYLESEFEVISQSFAQMMTQDTLKRVEAVADISQSLKDTAAKLKEEGRDADWQSLVPKDYTIWQPTKGNHFYWAQSLTEKALESFLRGEKELTAADFNEILALGGPRKQWVIPKRLAETLDNFGPQKDHAIEKFIGMGTSQWKRWTLFNPMRNLIYELNNLSGDADIAFAVDPKILSHTKKASSELGKFVLGKKAPTEKIDYLIKQGVIDAGFSVHELPDLKGQQFFRVLSGQEPGLIGKYWDTVLDFNRWREGVIRYAAYERALERINAGEQIYWTSKRSEIDGMRQDPNITNQEIAAKLAREAIGDYGNISHAGQWIRSKAIPFYSWMEINAPRYIRLFQNVKNEPGAQGRAAGMAGKRVAVGTAKTAVRAAALYLLINLWNKTMFPDEEDELGTNQKQLHVILGRREDGSIMSLRLQGALSDALGWFGAENVIKDVQDVATDRASVGDKLVESAKAPINRVAGGAFPIQKTLVEATLGRQTFPDVFDPRQVRDSGKHIARLFSVGTVYDYLTKKPQRPGTWSPLSLVTYAADPGEAAYYASKSIVSDWLSEKGKDRPETLANDKGNALYYHKQAIKYKDAKLADLWKQRYFTLGGTEKGLKSSIAKTKVTYGVALKDEKAFKASLSPAETQIIERAEKWHKATYGLP